MPTSGSEGPALSTVIASWQLRSGKQDEEEQEEEEEEEEEGKEGKEGKTAFIRRSRP